MTSMPNKLEVARIRVSFLEPFFGSIMYGIPCIPFGEVMEASMKAAGIPPTMATDGGKIYYSEEWVKGHSIDQLIGVLIHEIWHVVLKHHLRCDKLISVKNIEDEKKFATSRKWNKAADYAINPMVLEDGKVLPEGGFVDSKFHNHSSEQIYDLLPDDDDGGGGCEWGQVLSPGDMTEDEIREAEQDVETSVRQAAMTAKARGKVPGSVEKLIREWDEAKVDWQARLWRACDSYGGIIEDETWERPNRRFIQQGMYLPSAITYGPGTIAAAADTSGSVSDQEYKACMTEVSAIMQTCMPEKFILIQCDADIQGEPEVFENGDEFPTEITRRGYGGTSFKPPFDWLKKQEIRPQFMIYLTDGECSWPKEPDYPVIWVITTKITAPWGTTIHLTL